MVISSCLCNDLHVAGGCGGEDSARAQVKRVPECPLCSARQAKPFTCNFSGMSWVELLPHSLPYTLKSLICVNPLCPDSFGWDGAFFFFPNVPKQEKVKSTNSLSVDHISTFVTNAFLFYFQLLCACIV